MNNTLQMFLLAAGLAFCHASLAGMLDFSFSKTGLLSGWLPWLVRLQMGQRTEFQRQLNDVAKEDRYEVLTQIGLRHAKGRCWLYKPLGGCIYCMAFWFSPLAYLVCSTHLPLDLWALPVFMTAVFGWLRLLGY